MRAHFKNPIQRHIPSDNVISNSLRTMHVRTVPVTYHKNTCATDIVDIFRLQNDNFIETERLQPNFQLQNVCFIQRDNYNTWLE